MRTRIIFTPSTEAALTLKLLKIKPTGASLNSICLRHKKYADVVKTTSLVSLGGLLFRFYFLFANGY
jgi:hypothetical protein